MSCRRSSEIDLGSFLVESAEPQWRDFRSHYPSCPECTHAVAEWSTLEELLRSAHDGPESAHPPPETLRAFLRDPAGLPREKVESTRLHLDSCPTCRDGLKALAGFQFPAEMREAAVADNGGVSSPAKEATGRGIAGLLAAMRGAWDAVDAGACRPALVAIGLLALAIPVGVAIWRSLSEEPEPTRIAGELAPVQPQGSGPSTPREIATKPPPAEPTPSTLLPEPTQIAAPVEHGSSPEDLILHAPSITESPTYELPAPEMPPRDEPTQLAEDAGREIDRRLLVVAMAQLDLPKYRIPAAGHGPGRTLERRRGGGASIPTLLALAPDDSGQTLLESPTLYWFLSGSTESTVKFTLIDEDSVEPVLDLTILPPVKAGIHRVRLSEYGVALAPSERYEWFVSLHSEAERPEYETLAGGRIRRIVPSEALRAEISAAPPSDLGHVYSSAGLWYDAFDFFSSWLDDYPDEPALRRFQAALLKEVGLSEAAGSHSARP